jgi:23S rRNA pseudouridine1911/1915/1917 synthase
VAAGQWIELSDVPASRVRRGAHLDLDFRVVHVDDAIVVVDKPAGMVVHPSTTVRGGTLSELAERRFGPLPTPQGEERHGIVHRLDAETSGLVVLARTEEAGVELKRQFKAREVEKVYLALVHGEPRFDADWIEAPLGRAKKSPDRVSVVGEDEGRHARTFYEVHERFGCAALLACKPVTGRTHQIRVHLESIEHPVIGDKLYRGRRGRRDRLPEGAPVLARHALHAQHLVFRHPESGAPMAFEAPLPPELQELYEWLRARVTSAGS